jgi:hypothetical protein
MHALFASGVSGIVAYASSSSLHVVSSDDRLHVVALKAAMIEVQLGKDMVATLLGDNLIRYKQQKPHITLAPELTELLQARQGQ